MQPIMVILLYNLTLMHSYDKGIYHDSLALLQGKGSWRGLNLLTHT